MTSADNTFRSVLILILMEHAQRDLVEIQRVVRHGVLILILMEHAQRVVKIHHTLTPNDVLILILMEHAQRGHFL